MRSEDVYAILKKQIKELGITDEQIQQAVNIYLENHGVTIRTDKTLSEENVAADAKAVGESLNKKAIGENVIFSTNGTGGLKVTYDNGLEEVKYGS